MVEKKTFKWPPLCDVPAHINLKQEDTDLFCLIGFCSQISAALFILVVYFDMIPGTLVAALKKQQGEL